MLPRTLLPALLIGVLALVPAIAPNAFFLDMATKVIINAIVCVGLNLLVGYAGQISFGHAAFFALGGYASAILGSTYGVPPSAAMAIGAMTVGAIAYVIGRSILRLDGHYLAMATLAMCAIVAIVLNREIAVTGGPDGIVVPPLSFFGLPLSDSRLMYGAAALLLVLVVRTSSTLMTSRSGRALRALRESEIAASTLGIDVAAHKNAIFVISAVIASLAGSLFAHTDQFITPVEASLLRSVEFVSMIVVGGLGSIAGAILGATLLTILPHLLADVDEYRTLITGIALVLVMTLMPLGIAGSIARLTNSLKRARWSSGT